MTCGRVGSWKNRPTFEDLVVMFEGSTAGGAERAYRKAMDKLTELLVVEGAIHAVRHILSLSPDALTKYMLVPLEQPLIS